MNSPLIVQASRGRLRSGAASALSVCWSGVFRRVLVKEIQRLREAIVAADQSEEGYRTISKPFGAQPSVVGKIIHKREALKRDANLPQSEHGDTFTPRSCHISLKDTKHKH